MSDILVTSPYRPFTLPNQFKAVFNGYVYCGTVDAVDPSVSQVQVYLVNESGDKVPVAQPLRTNAGGFLVYNGQPAKFVTDSNHSLLVRDSLGNQLWYAPDMASADPETLRDEIYDNFTRVFDSVADMVAASNLTPGTMVRTAAFFSYPAMVKPVGGATYFVVNGNFGDGVVDHNSVASGVTLVMAHEGKVNATQIGCKPDGSEDVAHRVNTAIGHDDIEEIHFPTGDYRLDSTIILEKNLGGKMAFALTGSRSNINVKQGDTAPWLLIENTIKVKLDGLAAKSTVPNQRCFVETRGFWNSEVVDCFIEDWVHYNDVAGFYRQTFFCEWRNTSLLKLVIHTGHGVAGDPGNTLSEFNNNTFNNCNFLGGSYAIEVYGSWGIEGLRFNYCTFETQVGYMLYVDEPTSGEIVFNGCYIDAQNGGIPFDTKGLIVNFVENCDIQTSTPNHVTSLANTSARKKDTSVKAPYVGSYEPISLENLIKNGNLEETSTKMVSGTFTSASISYDSVSHSGKRLAVTANANSTFYIDSTPAPSDGYYAVMLVARSGYDYNVHVEGVDGITLFGTLSVSGGLPTQVSTCTFKATKGQTPRITFVSTADNNTILIDYIAVSFGKTSVLGPLKNKQKTSELLSESGVVEASGVTTLKRFALRSFLRSTFVVECFIEDFGFPDGTAYYRLAVNASETAATVTVLQSSTAGITANFTIINNVGSGFFDLNVEPLNGSAVVRFTTSGYYKNI
ncbi:MAG: phage tailspike protein [Aeromonadaceae bacterium]